MVQTLCQALANGGVRETRYRFVQGRLWTETCLSSDCGSSTPRFRRARLQAENLFRLAGDCAGDRHASVGR